MVRNSRQYAMRGLLGALALALAAVPGARANADSPESLQNLQRESDALTGQGRRAEAALLLLHGLRAIPPERTDLAAPAVGLVQALLFNTEYLMHPEERQAFYNDALDEENHPMDLLLATLMRYGDDAGITVEEAERCVQDLYRLAKGDNPFMRLGALFTMSSPYFLYDTGWAQMARDQIVEQFPESELAAEAQRLPLYRAEQWGADGLYRILNATDKNDELRAHSLRLREDAIGAAVYNNLQARGGQRDDAALADTLAAAATGAADWAEEYAALSILADLDPDIAGDRMRAAASGAIARNRDPRVVFRAHTIRLILARASGDAETLTADTGVLLDLAPIPLVPERNNYEELARSTRQSAGRLAELGQPEAASSLLQRLADRFPGSALESELVPEIESISETIAPAAAN